MSEEDIRRIVDRAIAAHERRGAIWSSAAGLAILAGICHAIWLLRFS